MCTFLFPCHKFPILNFQNACLFQYFVFKSDCRRLIVILEGFSVVFSFIAIIYIRFSSIFIENCISFSHACCRFSTDLMFAVIFRQFLFFSVIKPIS